MTSSGSTWVCTVVTPKECRLYQLLFEHSRHQFRLILEDDVVNEVIPDPQAHRFETVNILSMASLINFLAWLL